MGVVWLVSLRLRLVVVVVVVSLALPITSTAKLLLDYYSTSTTEER